MRDSRHWTTSLFGWGSPPKAGPHPGEHNALARRHYGSTIQACTYVHRKEAPRVRRDPSRVPVHCTHSTPGTVGRTTVPAPSHIPSKPRGPEMCDWLASQSNPKRVNSDCRVCADAATQKGDRAVRANSGGRCVAKNTRDHDKAEDKPEASPQCLCFV